MKPIIIIGTGLAGYSLARNLRRQDQDLPLLLFSEDNGANYYKPNLSDAFSEGNGPEDLVMKTAEEMAQRLDADIRTQARIAEIHPDEKYVETASGERHEYVKLVLATGARQRQVPLEGEAADRVMSVNSLDDYRAFRSAIEDKKKIAILGAGLIGCEFANDLTNGGYAVTVIDPADGPLRQLLPAFASDALRQGLEGIGIEFHFNTLAQTVSPQNDGLCLALDNGKRLEVDAVLSAIGLTVDAQLAEQAGLKTNRGIVADRYLQTSAEDVYALGDCAEVAGWLLQHVMPVQHAARALAATLSGEATRVSYPCMPVIVKTPARPVVVSPPHSDDGDWQIEQPAPDLKAFYRVGKEPIGMVLTGEAAGEQRELVKQLPPYLD